MLEWKVGVVKENYDQMEPDNIHGRGREAGRVPEHVDFDLKDKKKAILEMLRGR